MITPGLVRVVYEERERELVSKIEMKRKIAEAREAKTNQPAPKKTEGRSFVQLLSEKIFSRQPQKSIFDNTNECPTPCLEHN